MNIKLWRVGCMQSSILIHMGPLFLMQISHCCFSHAFFSRQITIFGASIAASTLDPQLSLSWWLPQQQLEARLRSLPSLPTPRLLHNPKKMLGDCIPLRGGMIKDSQRHVNVQSIFQIKFCIGSRCEKHWLSSDVGNPISSKNSLPQLVWQEDDALLRGADAESWIHAIPSSQWDSGIGHISNIFPKAWVSGVASWFGYIWYATSRKTTLGNHMACPGLGRPSNKEGHVSHR